MADKPKLSNNAMTLALLAASLFFMTFIGLQIAYADKQQRHQNLASCGELRAVQAMLSNGEALALCLNEKTGAVTIPVTKPS